MRTVAANFGANGWGSVCKSVWQPAVRLVFCALFLLCIQPRLLAQNVNPDLQNGAATTHLSKRQAERKAEIRQRKIDNPEAEDGQNVYRHSPMVHKLARLFGLSVEVTSRLFEIVNFVLLVILIIWGIAKFLPKALRERSERIRTEIEQARIATEDANRRLANVEQRLSRLDDEIEAIRTQAQQETGVEEKRLRAALEQEKQSILDSATQDINAATKNAQSLLKKLAADLVIEHAKRQVAVSPETDQTLVAGFLADVNEKHPRGGVN